MHLDVAKESRVIIFLSLHTFFREFQIAVGGFFNKVRIRV